MSGLLAPGALVPAGARIHLAHRRREAAVFGACWKELVKPWASEGFQRLRQLGLEPGRVLRQPDRIVGGDPSPPPRSSWLLWWAEASTDYGVASEQVERAANAVRARASRAAVAVAWRTGPSVP